MNRSCKGPVMFPTAQLFVLFVFLYYFIIFIFIIIIIIIFCKSQKTAYISVGCLGAFGERRVFYFNS